MEKKKIIIISTVSVIVILVGLNFFLKASPKDAFQLETTQLSIKKISTSVTATGTIEPISEVAVGTQVSGIISKLYVDYNSVVKKGQILAELDKTNLQSELVSQEMLLRSSKVEYEYQQKNFNRAKDLHSKNLISDTDYETAKYNFEKSEAAYKQSQSNMVKVRTNLSYATIHSPIDGVILSRAVEEGQTVAASFSTPTLFTIANDLTKMKVVANVDEADIGNVRNDEHVTFTVDAYPNDVFDGSVTQVRLNPTTTSNVVTYQVIVNAPNPSLKLKPGLTANITIFTMEKAGVQSLPNKTLNFKPDSTALLHNGFEIKESKEPALKLAANEKVIWIQDGKTLKQKKIAIGDTDGINTEVVSGISDKELVVLEMKILSMNESPKAPGESSPFMPKRPGSNSKSSKNTPPAP